MGSKLYIGNLPFAVTSEELGELFGQAGDVVSADVITDRFSGQSRGFGFVEMASDEAAQSAIGKFNDYAIKGRSLRVNEAKPREDRDRGGAGRSGGNQHRRR